MIIDQLGIVLNIRTPHPITGMHLDSGVSIKGKFGLLVFLFGLMARKLSEYLALWFLFISPSGFGLNALPPFKLLPTFKIPKNCLAWDLNGKGFES